MSDEVTKHVPGDMPRMLAGYLGPYVPREPIFFVEDLGEVPPRQRGGRRGRPRKTK